MTLGDSFQGLPEESDAECLLSRKRVRHVAPAQDMLASRASGHSHSHRRVVLQQKSVERSDHRDPLDHISWNQQLHEYRMVADDVSPDAAKDRCPIRRINVQKSEDVELDKLDKPVIFTNVFDAGEDWTSDLSKAGHGHSVGDTACFSHHLASQRRPH